MSLRVGCIGLGIGRTHVSFYQGMPDVRITAVCDVAPGLAASTAAEYGAAAYQSYEEMFDSERLQAVSNCTPPALHRPITEAAAARGIHVLCEKPMAPTLEDCQAMIDACAGAGVILMIGLKRRFSPYYRFIKDRCDESGDPLMWGSVRYALGRVDKDWFWDPGNGRGPLLENAVHMLDAIRYLMGDVRRVNAVGGNFFMQHRAPVPDVAAVTLEFVSGAVASLGLGYGSEWSMAREEVAFAGASMAFDLCGPFDRASSLRYVQRSKPAEIHTPELHGEGPFTGGFAEELAHFVACVREGAPPSADGRAGLESVRLCLAVQDSLARRAPVELKR